jgi:hypothetical protein
VNEGVQNIMNKTSMSTQDSKLIGSLLERTFLNKMPTEYPNLTRFERLIVDLTFTEVPEKCNVCGKQIGSAPISRLNELMGPRICDSCVVKPEIKEIMRRVDPDESVIFWRRWYRNLSS